MIKVPYVDIGSEFRSLEEPILAKIQEVGRSGQFVLGDALEAFEKNFAAYCGVKHSLGVANGTDALVISMKALGIGSGDEVITAPNSFLSTAAAILMTGATPVFADVCPDFNIDPARIRSVITENTKAILPIHLTGRPALMDEIMAIAKQRSLFVIEDAAQAVGARINMNVVGSIGDTGCFSLHPLKNLSALGDGGMITTNDERLYQSMKKLRNHGFKNRDECELWGYNSRLDSLQAAVLDIKLTHLPQWTDRLRSIATRYHDALQQLVVVPQERSNEYSVYHTFIIQTENRNSLQEFLLGQGIQTKVHYPIPIHLQQSARSLGYKEGDFPVAEKQAKQILSLPIYPHLRDEQVTYVIEKIQEFFA